MSAESTTRSADQAGASPQSLIEEALAAATLPVTVIVRDIAQANVRWASNQLTTNGQMQSRELTVISFAPVSPDPTAERTGEEDDASVEGATATAVGVISRQAGDDHDVAAQVAAAETAARAGRPAEDAAPLIGTDADRDADFDHAPAGTDIAVFARVAPRLGEAFARAGAEGRLLFGFAEHIVTTTYLASSTGLRRRGVVGTGRFELNAKSADLSASAWVGAASADFTDVDVAALDAEVTTRLGWHARTVELPPGRYETILPPSAVADLFIYAYWSAGARAAEEGRSVFSASRKTPSGESSDSGATNQPPKTRIGERLAPLPISLVSDPAAAGVECEPFVITVASGEMSSVFDNGAPVARTEWISDGVLTDLIRTRAQAKATGSRPTSEIDNLIMDGGGTASLAEMIKNTKRGLLLTCLWYIREVDPQTLLLTGLTRDGVYLIEDGEIVGAVTNYRFNESPIGLLSRSSEVGRTEKTLPREWNDWFTRTIMPPIRVPDFNMSTVSQAQ